MAENFAQVGTYRNVPVYDDFDYIDPVYAAETLSPVWTTSGMLVPIAHSDTPAYMRIPREECIKMINDLLCLDECRKVLGLTIKKD